MAPSAFIQGVALAAEAIVVWMRVKYQASEVGAGPLLARGQEHALAGEAGALYTSVPPIESVLLRFPHKRVVVAFPPKRSSTQLKQAASAAFSIFPQTIQSNHLPDPVRTSGGVELQAPSGWLP